MIFALCSFLGTFWSALRFKFLETTEKEHKDQCEVVEEQFKKSDGHVSTNRKGGAKLRIINSKCKVDLKNFTKIIQIDHENKLCWAQSGCCFGTLVKYLI